MKLCSMNVEGHIHLHERVIPFLKKEQPDVICLQEVFFRDIPLLEAELGMQAHFGLMANVEDANPVFNQPYGMIGVVILTRGDVKSVQHQYYAPTIAVDDLNEYLAPRLKDADFSPTSVEIPFEVPILSHPNAMWRVLSSLDIEVDGEWYRVAHTHFTWADKGMFTQKQADDFRSLWTLVEDLGEHVLCGDFNSPRGGDGDGTNIYDQLADRMSSAVPLEEISTLDENLHRAGRLDLVVDGIFTTPTYSVSDIRLESGVSDHKALVAQVEKMKF